MRRRRALKLLLLLLAGAIINVAVAWGCVLLFDRSEREYLSDDEAAHSIRQYLDINEPTARRDSAGFFTFAQAERSKFTGHQFVSMTYTRTRLSRKVQADENERQVMIFETVAGWPMLCVRGAWGSHLKSPLVNYLRIPKPLQNRSPQFSVLPLSIARLPFAINTIFYAAVLWVLFAVPGAVRRRVRIKRGQCASCGYSLRGRDITSEKCPECGALACVARVV